MRDLVQIDAAAVKRAYARWAPVYDTVFGSLVRLGCREAMKIVNRTNGTLLEVGVGTGISLDQYRSDISITAIDISPEMLARAEAKAARLGLDNVEALLPMDAGKLEFGDARFDKVVALFVLTVVPDPEKVMAEMERVCKPGGEVIVVNHFSASSGWRSRAERVLAPLASALGWRPEFPLEKVLGQDRLRLVERVSFGPLGMFTLLRFERLAKPARPDQRLRNFGDKKEPAPARVKPVPVPAGLHQFRE